VSTERNFKLRHQIPHADEGRNCPFNGKDMSEVCHRCPLWIQVRGVNPNTGESIDRWDCSFALLPTLLIENSQMQRQTGAAVESFRNEMVKANRNHAADLVAQHQRLLAAR
jgi:hypothetical protein